MAIPRLVRLPFRPFVCGVGVSACIVREFVLWIDCGSGCRGYAASAATASLHLLLPLMSFLLLWVVAACSGSSGSSGIECGVVVRVVYV